MRVIVYYNLNRGDWTIANVKGNRGKGIKIRGADSVTLKDCFPVVQNAARLAVIRTKCKSVHSWIVGELVDSIPSDLIPVPITYNPYLSEEYHRRDNNAVVCGAEYVLLGTDGKAIAYGVR
jgi:hypothetical protein